MTDRPFHRNGQLHWPLVVPVCIALVSAGALASAYVAEYLFGLAPCQLCLYQRIPYAVTGLAAIIALMVEAPKVRGGLVVLCVGVFLVGAGIAFYHVGVEQHWWASAAGCGGSLPLDMSTADLRAALSAPPDPACDEPTWVILGISMATWNAVFSLALAAATFYGYRRMRSQE